MSAGIQLIVGLGNPGAQYEQTRHNAGAWLISQIAEQTNISLQHQSKFQAFHAIAHCQQHDFHLLLPTTFMNLSGQSVAAFINYYKIAPANILIAHDEIDLPTADIRLKFDGGHGGHNGLRDVINHLHTRQFYRLRIGVGRPPAGQKVDAYVLHPPSKIERGQINVSLNKAIDILPLALKGELQQAMQRLHTNHTEHEE